LWLDTEKRKKVLGNGDTGQALGLTTLAGEITVADALESEIGSHVRERFVLFAEVEEMADLCGLARKIEQGGTYWQSRRDRRDRGKEAGGGEGC